MLTVKEMIEVIDIEAKSTLPWTGRQKISAQVLAAMAGVPRHEFVPQELRHSAYDVPFADWIWADNLAALHCRPDDRPAWFAGRRGGA